MVKNVSIYLSVKFFSQIILFFSNLVIAWLLAAEDFAIIGTHYLIISMLMPLSNLGLHSGLERYYPQYNEDTEKQAIFTSFVAGMIINITVAFLIFILFARWTPENYTSLFLLISLGTFVLQSSQYIPLVILRARQTVYYYSALFSLSILISQFLVIFALLWSPNVHSFFYGTGLGSVCSLLIWLSWITRNSKPVLSDIRRMANYSLKSLPMTALEIIQHSFDRIFLLNLLPSVDFGLYAFGQRFASSILSVSSAAKTAIYPIIYSIKVRKEAVSFLEEAGVFSIISFSFMASVISLVVSISFEFFVKEEYALAYPIFLILLFGCFLRTQETIFSVGADLELVPHYRAYVLAPIALFVVALSYPVIWQFGYFGAAAMFVFYSALRLTAFTVQANKIVPRNFQIKLIVGLNLLVFIILSGQFYNFIDDGKFISYLTFLPMVLIIMLLVVALLIVNYQLRSNNR